MSISPETLELDGREGAGSSTPMNLSRLNGAQALVAAAILAAVLLAAVVGTVALVIREQIRVVEAVEHTYEVERNLTEFLAVIERTEGARRGMLLNNNLTSFGRFRGSVDRASPLLDQLQRLTADNAVQQARIPRLRDLMNRQLAYGEADIRAILEGRQADAVSQFRQQSQLESMEGIRELADVMIADERRLLIRRNAAAEAQADRLFAVMAGLAVVLGLAAIGMTLMLVAYARDLTSSRLSLATLNAELEDRVVERTVELQKANAEIQRFAYIVSHDLRSPLVNIMGFTSELETSIKPMAALLDAVEADAPQMVTPAVREAVRGDLPEAIRFIRTSTQKMDRLINAILKLSREGRRVLAPEHLAMAPLLESIAGSLKQRSDAADVAIVVDTALPNLFSDRVAIEQVFSNLIENAVKYRKKGQGGEVRVTGRRDAGRLVYDVSDNGRGVDPRDHERIFDLFRRSGAQDQQGEGIGLATVRALVHRLGGVITVESALDRGSTFRVSLPPVTPGEGQESA